MVSIAVIFGPLTGAHVNPAVTIVFWAVGKFPTELVLGYIIAQCIGAFIGALIVWLLFKDHLDEEDNQNCQLGSFATIATNSNNFAIYFLKLSPHFHCYLFYSHKSSTTY